MKSETILRLQLIAAWLFSFYCLASSLTSFVDTESFLLTLVNPAGTQALQQSSLQNQAAEYDV